MAMMNSLSLSLIMVAMSGWGTAQGIFYPFGSAAGDTSSSREDDGSSPKIYLLSPFSFFGHTYQQIYVNHNGLLTFNQSSRSFQPYEFPSNDSRDIIALFWTDLDNREKGSISYQQYTAGEVLQNATQDISSYFPSVTFNASWVFVATWDRVAYHPNTGTETTFQVVLISGSNLSFVLMNYGDIAPIPNSKTVQIGYDSNSTHFWSLRTCYPNNTIDVVNLNTSSNIYVPGRWAFATTLQLGNFNWLNTRPTTCLPKDSAGIAASVICMENFMAFALDRSSTNGLHEDHMRLNDPNCTLYSNGTHVLANMSLTTCGTMMEEDGDYLIFRNAVVSFDDPSDIISRSSDVEIEFFCKYPKKSQVTAQFDVHRPSLSFAQKGFGTFTYQFEFFQSDLFAQMMDPKTYPLKFNLGDMMYMQIEAISSVPDTELFVESCSAAPSDNPNEPLSYRIIENGCKVDETVYIYSSHQTKVQLGMKAFKFIGLHDQVFITCSVILCKAGESGSRCSQGCTNSSSSGHIVSKREAPIQTAKHYISQGPLRLRQGVSDTVAQPTSVNMNLIVVVGGLLAAVAMVCGVLIYKTVKSEVKCERLPSDL